MQGYKVGVYDKLSNQYVLSAIANKEEMSEYIGGPDEWRYIFVLSEDTKHLGGVNHSFALMELKRRAGYPLFEEYLKGK